MQDNKGFLWVGTEGGGVCKFDGKTFTTFNKQNGLAAENVRIIFQDDRGVIWFGTSNGLSYYDGYVFKTLKTEDGLPDNFVRSITQDHEGNIWIGTNRGISILDPDEKGVSGKVKINFNLPNKKVRALLAIQDVVWIGTDGGLCKYQDHEIEVFTREDGLSDDLILTLFTDSYRNLWVGTEMGVSKVSEEGIQYWTEDEGLISNRVRAMTEDHYGNIWIGTNDGISIFDGWEFSNLTQENGLSNERIRCLNTDSFDNIWVGTFFGGIMRFNHQDFIAYTEKTGLISNQILSIEEDFYGNILVGTFEGASYLNICHSLLLTTGDVELNNGHSSNAVNAIYRDRIDYWYGTLRGLAIVKDDQTIVLDENDGLENTVITCIKKFNDQFWVGTEGGLAVITESDESQYEVQFYNHGNGLAGDHVSDIAQHPNGDVWISFADGQVSIFEKEKFLNPTLPQEIHAVFSIEIDTAGTVWIGTGGSGIYFGEYDVKSHSIDLNNLSKKDGLCSNSIYSILITEEGYWTGHENGIGLLSLEEDTLFTIRTFGPERGFSGMQNNPNACFKDSGGNLWFGTVNGLFCLKADEISNFIEGKPSINYIKDVIINGHEVDWSNSDWCQGQYSSFDLPKDLVLPYNKNNVSFDFIGLNLVSPDKVKYSWMLEGFDVEWSIPTKNSFVSYTNLEPGEYIFKVKTSNELGFIVGEPAEFKFKIQKPFWQTWLFRIGTGVVVALLVMLIFRLRTRALIKQRRVLENVVQERTQEIQSQANELKQKNDEITDSIQYARRIQASVLPNKDRLNKSLQDYFILYLPKDIVSGDFYWMEPFKTDDKISRDGVLIAAADCTGHGVPGAMVSVVCNNALNRSVREFGLTKPGEILDKTREIVIQEFEKSDENVKDGMDIAMLSIVYLDNGMARVQFAGAHNPLWIIKKDTESINAQSGVDVVDYEHTAYSLIEVKADKQPIGKFDDLKPYTTYTFELHEGDSLYVFTDGYADQFGGEKGKKFKAKTLKEILIEIQEQSMSDQKDTLHKAIEEWRGNLEQVDDICVIGIKL